MPIFLNKSEPLGSRRGLLSKTQKTARSGLQHSNGSSEKRLKTPTVRAAARADGPKLQRQRVSRYRTSKRQINRYFSVFKFVFFFVFQNSEDVSAENLVFHQSSQDVSADNSILEVRKSVFLHFLTNVSAETAIFQTWAHVSSNSFTFLC